MEPADPTAARSFLDRPSTAGGSTVRGVIAGLLSAFLRTHLRGGDPAALDSTDLVGRPAPLGASRMLKNYLVRGRVRRPCHHHPAARHVPRPGAGAVPHPRPRSRCRTCASTAAPLSGGWVSNDSIVCPYHGWEYEPGGAVKDPANQPGRGIPKKARVDSYPVRERYGFLWVFLGDLPEAERPPIPVWPEFDDLVGDGGQYKAVTGEYLWRSTTSGSSRTAATSRTRRSCTPAPSATRSAPTSRSTSWRSPTSGRRSRRSGCTPPAPKGIWSLVGRRGHNLKDRPPVATTAGWMLPNMIKLHVRLPLGNLIIYDTNIPVDETTTLVKWVALRDASPATGPTGTPSSGSRRSSARTPRSSTGSAPSCCRSISAPSCTSRIASSPCTTGGAGRNWPSRSWLLGEEDRIMGDVPRREATVIASPARRGHPELARAWVHKAKGEHPTVAEAERIGKARRDAEDNGTLEEL
ncbi:Rieske 2Fe-2S domain-containing protein [Streptomyces sp. NBC_00464]